MNTELEQACKLVAEKILGWKYISRKSGGMSAGGMPHWITTLGRKYGHPKRHLLTGNGMAELMDALREYTPSIFDNRDHYAVYLRSDGIELYGQADPQEALVLAASKLAEDMK